MESKEMESFVAQVWNALGNSPLHPQKEEGTSEAVQALSITDMRVLHELGKGLTTEKAAEKLDMSPRSLRSRVYYICRRLNVNTPIEAIIIVAREKSKERNPSDVALSNEDIELLAVIATGVTTKVAAQDLKTDENTLRRRIRNICSVLDVKTPIEAVVWAARRQLI